MKTATNLERLTKSWRWLFDPNCYALLEVSPFGDLLMRDSSGALCLLDVNMGDLVYADLDGDDPAKLFPIAFDMRIAIGYIEAGLLPEDGQCFGYKEQLVAGGSLATQNVYVATLTEYVDFMGDFHHQIQDIADGETVTLKVKRALLN